MATKPKEGVMMGRPDTDGNLAALARHEREMERAERRHDENEAAMQSELDEHIEAMWEILARYDMRVLGIEYVEDKI